MSMQIHVDPAGLSQEQREAVAGFILAYPASNVGSILREETDCAGSHHAVAEIHAVNELEALQHDHESTMPEAAFGSHGSSALDADAAKLNAIFGQGAAGPTLADVDLAPAAAFGGAAVPLTAGQAFGQSPDGVALQSPATTAQPPVNLGHVSSAAPVTSAGVELDKDGLPWDSRIHVESRNKNSDGRWRKKRSLDSAVCAQVEAELRQLMGAPAAPLAPAPTPAQPAATPVIPAPPAPSAPVMPAAPNVAPAGEVPQDARAQFVGLVGRASAAIQAGKVSQAEVNQICNAAGVPALPLLANRLDLVAHVAGQVDALIASRG